MAQGFDRGDVKTLVDVPGCAPVEGWVRWDPVHSLWNGIMLSASLAFAPLLFSWSALLVFVVLTGATLLLGHSVGFHRRLIHRSFACPLWLERILVWIGTCVGMSGPLRMVRTHDLRDWAQRRSDCHDYLAHRRSMLVDGWWQLHCRLELARPPAFDPGRAGSDPFYRFLEATWMAQQVPIALLLFVGGGGAGWFGGSASASAPRSRAIGLLGISRTAPGHRAGWLTKLACRHTTCRGRRYRPWARRGTTIIMPFPDRRGLGFIPDRATGVMRSSCRSSG